MPGIQYPFRRADETVFDMPISPGDNVALRRAFMDEVFAFVTRRGHVRPMRELLNKAEWECLERHGVEEASKAHVDLVVDIVYWRHYCEYAAVLSRLLTI
jgi:hypothetical protein